MEEGLEDLKFGYVCIKNGTKQVRKFQSDVLKYTLFLSGTNMLVF